MKSKLFILFLLTILCVSMVSAETTKIFKLDILDNYRLGDIGTLTTDVDGDGGDLVTAVVRVTNEGSAIATKKVECGIYTRDVVTSWHPQSFFSIFSLGNQNVVSNCVTSESNVQTKSLSIGAGQEKIVQYSVRVPNTNPNDRYVWHCQAYDYCWKDVESTTGDTGTSDWDYVSFDIVDSDNIATCSDGIKNQAETDTDCGGTCKGCFNGQLCNRDSDCLNLNCVSGACEYTNQDKSDTETGGNDDNTGDAGDDDAGDGEQPIYAYVFLGIVGFLLLFSIYMMVKK